MSLGRMCLDTKQVCQQHVHVINSQNKPNYTRPVKSLGDSMALAIHVETWHLFAVFVGFCFLTYRTHVLLFVPGIAYLDVNCTRM